LRFWRLNKKRQRQRQRPRRPRGRFFYVRRPRGHKQTSCQLSKKIKRTGRRAVAWFVSLKNIAFKRAEKARARILAASAMAYRKKQNAGLVGHFRIKRFKIKDLQKPKKRTGRRAVALFFFRKKTLQAARAARML
jgi:hypothetical protein